MRILISVGVITILGLFMGVFVVDDRQIAYVTSQTSTKGTVYKTGIHFAVPIWDKVTYVYINQRNSIVQLDLVSTDPAHPKLKAELLLNWQVDNPQIYLSKLNRLNKSGFNQILSERVLTILSRQLDSKTLEHVNQSETILANPEKLNDLGIKLNAININSLQIINGQQESQVITNAMVSVTPKKIVAVESATESSTATSSLATVKPDGKLTTSAVISAQKLVASNVSASVLMESAYYQAKIIKGEADLEVATINQKLLVADPKFYEYFNRLNTYKKTAKSVADMPPLSDLYKYTEK